MISILIPSGICLAVYWARYLWNTFKLKKRVSLLVPLAFTCLFIPKVTLMQINPDHSMAGIRTDDILALVMLAAAVIDARNRKNRKILWGIAFLGALTVSNLISLMVGQAFGYENSVKFSIFSIIRKYEYFAFAVIGLAITRKTKEIEKTALTEFTIMSGFHLLIGLMQVFKVCGYAVSGFLDYVPSYWEGLPISTFNGHYEYGQFLCFGVVIYLCAFMRTKKIRWLGMLAVSLAMIWLTDCRTSLIVGALTAALMLLFSISRIRNRRVRNGIIAGVVVAFATGVILAATGVVNIGRFGTIDLNEYAEAWKYYIHDHPDLRKYAALVKSGAPEWHGMGFGITDGSAAGRFFKWGNALDGLRNYPLFGYGTGVTEVMDGNYIKLLGESGIIGTLLFLGMFGYYMKTVWSARKKTGMARSVLYMMVSVLLASVFIDMFEASKPMEMMWLAIGLAGCGQPVDSD